MTGVLLSFQHIQVMPLQVSISHMLENAAAALSLKSVQADPDVL